MTLLPDQQPPIAAQRPFSETRHGITRHDPYHWLRDPGYPDVTDTDVLAYLEAENTYFAAAMGQHQGLIDQLFDEIKSRIPEDDSSVPWVEGAWEYRWAYLKGTQYRQWYRRPVSLACNDEAEEKWQLILDENLEADGQDYFKLGSMAISHDGRMMAYSLDTNGSERFTIKIRDLISGKDLNFSRPQTSGEIVWSRDNSALISVHLSDEWRPFRVDYTNIADGQSHSLYEEQDSSFFVHISNSADSDWLIVRSADHVTAECHAMPLDMSAPLAMLITRTAGHDHDLDHGRDGFWIRSNRDSSNFSLYRAEHLLADWQPILSGSDQLYILGFSLHSSFTAVSVRQNGLSGLLVLSADGIVDIPFDEAAYDVGLGHNPDYDQKHLRYSYSSMITPNCIYDREISSGETNLRKQQQIPAGYHPGDYRIERIRITARDGAEVPVSIVMHKNWQAGPDAKLHLYGYGAYGISIPPSFSPARLSLLDRNMAYAIAHIRGGDDLGYHWYTAGKLATRENTFNDFVDVARGLIDKGYSGAGNISVSGGSAGGELMGAITNQAPDLFGAVVMHVPFVDVLNTMLDDSLPLTPIEWPEWGNPIDSAEAYHTIAAYCPYSNMTTGNYPPMMVTGGLNDPRVTYWEPAKYVAKLRSLKTDTNPLIMKINMGAGHGGKSGRFERYVEVAEEYAFVLLSLGEA